MEGNTNKSNYYNSCQNSDSDYYQNYNVIGKNVCAYGNSKKYESENESADIHNKISNICKQTYCENGNYENFCYKYQKVYIMFASLLEKYFLILLDSNFWDEQNQVFLD